MTIVLEVPNIACSQRALYINQAPCCKLLYETTKIILVVAVVVSNAKVNVRYWVGPIVTGYPHADKTWFTHLWYLKALVRVEHLGASIPAWLPCRTLFSVVNQALCSSNLICFRCLRPMSGLLWIWQSYGLRVQACTSCPCVQRWQWPINCPRLQNQRREKVAYCGRGDMEPNPWLDHVNFNVEKIPKEAFALNMVHPLTYCYWSGHYKPERLRRFLPVAGTACAQQ